MTRFGSKTLLALGSAIRKHQQNTIHNHATEDPEGSTKGDSSGNIQRTTCPKAVDDEGCKGRGDGHNTQRGNNSVVIEPRSYRDAVVNGSIIRSRLTQQQG